MTQKRIISDPVLNSPLNSSDFLKDAMAKFKAGQSFTGKDGILTPVIKQIVDATLDCEMDQHLEQCSENGEPNRRNGKLYKTLKTADAAVEIETPRDRAGTFEPQEDRHVLMISVIYGIKRYKMLVLVWLMNMVKSWFFIHCGILFAQL